MPEFDRSTPVTVAVHTHSGKIDIHAEESATVVADVVPLDGSDASRQAAEQTVVALEGDTLMIRAPEKSGWTWRRSGRLGVTVRVPLDSSIAVKSASADLRATGRFAEAQVAAGSGDVQVDDVTGSAHLGAASGDVTVGRVGGSLRITNSSGDLTVGDVSGDVSADAASGDIEIGSAGGSVQAATASGDIEIGVVRRGETRVRSASGDVTVGVAAGTGVWLDVSTASGSTKNDLTMGGAEGSSGSAALHLRVRTASGDIQIRRVAEPFPAAA
ncbi:MAG TPA: DUF4097 family beta strand repeat-containing protein [Actinoplanes sp.]|nr:DUF4097 family beta strand repeat-containing protein [Actinoplanes sp.]